MLTVEDSRQRPPAVVFLKLFERCQRGFNDVPIVPLAQIGTSIYLTVFLCLCSYWHVWVHIVFIANLLSNAIFIFTVLLQRLTFTWALYCQCLPKSPRCNSRWPPHWSEMILERGVDFLLRRKIFRRLRSYSHTCHHVMDCLCPKAKRGRSIRQSSSSRCTRCIVAAARNIKFDWPFFYCSSSSRSIRLWFFYVFFFQITLYSYTEHLHVTCSHNTTLVLNYYNVF